MRSIIFRFLVLSIVCSFVLAGCRKGVERTGKFNEEQMAGFALVDPTRTDLPDPSGGVVLSVGGDVVTAEEIISMEELKKYLSSLAKATDFKQFRNKAGGAISQAVLNKTVDLLLYQMARKKAPDTIDEALDTAAESEVNRFVANYSNNYAMALKEIKRRGLVDWEGFRTFQKRMLLTQSFMAEEMKDPRPISREEMLTYYKKVRDEQFSWEGGFEFSLIDIRTENLLAEQVKEGETKDAAVKRIGQEAMSLYEKGSDFGELAKKYSHGVYRAKGGKWGMVGFGALVKPYDVLEKYAKSIKAGQVVGPIAVDGRVFVMRIDSVRFKGAAPFSDVEAQIKESIEFARRRAKYDALVKDLIAKANVADMNRFIEYCLAMAYKKQ
jgi:hypothetical protein